MRWRVDGVRRHLAMRLLLHPHSHCIAEMGKKVKNDTKRILQKKKEI